MREQGVRDDSEVSGLGDLVVGGFVERKLASHEFTVSLSFLGKLLITNKGDSTAVFNAIEKRCVMV